MAGAREEEPIDVDELPDYFYLKTIKKRVVKEKIFPAIQEVYAEKMDAVARLLDPNNAMRRLLIDRAVTAANVERKHFLEQHDIDWLKNLRGAVRALNNELARLQNATTSIDREEYEDIYNDIIIVLATEKAETAEEGLNLMERLVEELKTHSNND